MLRVDNAVLHTVNLVRRGEGLDPCTREQILALFDFSPTVDVEGDVLTITVRTDDAALGIDEMTLKVDGGGTSVEGPVKQKILEDLTLSWKVRVLADSGEEVVRLQMDRHPAEFAAIVAITGRSADLATLFEATEIKVGLSFEEATLGCASFDKGFHTLESPYFARVLEWDGWIGWTDNTFETHF